MNEESLVMEKAAARQLNAELLQECRNTEPGNVVKRASDIASKATRTQIREEGVRRTFLPYEDVTPDSLEYFGDTELGARWFELEPQSPAARSIPYDASPNTEFFRAEKYAVVFALMTTEELTKNVHELVMYKTDIKGMAMDNQLRDIHTLEDIDFFAEADRLVGTAVSVDDPTSWSPMSQNVNMNAAITRMSVKRANRLLTDRKVPRGVQVANVATIGEFNGWPHDEIGGSKAQEILVDGLSALQKLEFFKTPYIASIKSEVFANGVIWQFAPSEWLGHSLRLADIVVTIRKDYDIIRIRAQQHVGTTIGNTRSVQKSTFTMSGADWLTTGRKYPAVQQMTGTGAYVNA